MMEKRTAAQSFGRRRWRAWVARYLLLALIWPAIGPLPWLIDFTSEHEHAGVRAHHDVSEVPGSPTHPDDHNCFQCDVIKHLARCVPSACAFPVVARVPVVSPRPPILVESLHAAFVVAGPPIRGPPLLVI